MRVAIICNEAKPVPAVEGGAVETLVDLIIENNEKKQGLNIDIYSKYNKEAFNASKNIKNTNFYYIKYFHKIERMCIFLNKVLGKLHIKSSLHSYLFNVVKELKKHEYDWIIIENRPLYVQYVKKQYQGAKVALHLHNDTVNKEKFYAQSVINLCDKILSVSEYIKNRVSEVTPTENDINKVVTLENRINIKKFESYNSDFLIEKYNISPNEKIILYHGRVVKEKGVLELIQAYGYAFEKNPLLRLVIIGEISDFAYERKLKNAINQLPINKVLLIGYVKNDDLPKYLASANIIVLPSLVEEAFGLTIVESMAMGKPVIATNVGAIPDILSENCGILVGNDNKLIDNLANEILDLAEDSKKQQILSENGRRKVVSKYNSDEYLSKLIDKLK